MIALLSLLLGALIVSIFCRLEFKDFMFHTFRYYDSVLAAGNLHQASLYFTPEIIRIFGYSGTKLLLLTGQVVILGIAFLKLNSLRRLFGFLAGALFFILLFNTVTWTYQYLLIGALIWLALMTLHEPERVNITH